MSIAIMTEVWKIEGLSASQKLVFLSLADNANDQGECYPSIRQIAARTCLSERAVRDAVRSLERLGYVSSASRAGTSSTYLLTTSPENINPPPRQMPPPTPAGNAAPANAAPRQEMPTTPATDAPPPRQMPPPTPAAAAPKPSINRQLNHHLTITSSLPDWLPESAWADWLEHRGKKFSDRAKQLSLRTLSRLHDQGHDPTAVIERSIERGWTGLFPLDSDRRGRSPSGATDEYGVPL
ncbi:helix-turn-helix domain-containing protein [Castellaniella caeni]|uniref:helix-turn-helix domain-containing protein n=1 Tax=Castellaniella caeni TaxID=266123 RepID=UPI000C9EDB3E|nr:helix-turn-helix domain-containing protein [Castellaniella caeni]